MKVLHVQHGGRNSGVLAWLPFTGTYRSQYSFSNHQGYDAFGAQVLVLSFALSNYDHGKVTPDPRLTGNRSPVSNLTEGCSAYILIDRKSFAYRYPSVQRQETAVMTSEPSETVCSAFDVGTSGGQRLKRHKRI